MDKPFISDNVLQDLVQVHRDRIGLYSEALHATHLELDLRDIFERMIRESSDYLLELNEKFQPVDIPAGQVYQAWKEGLNVPIVPGDKKSILASCSNDQLALLNAYSLALSLPGQPVEVKQALERQQEGIRELHHFIRQYHDAQ